MKIQNKNNFHSFNYKKKFCMQKILYIYILVFSLKIMKKLIEKTEPQRYDAQIQCKFTKIEKSK